MNKTFLLALVLFSFATVSFTHDSHDYQCICTSYGFTCVGHCTTHQKNGCNAYCNTLYIYNTKPFHGKSTKTNETDLNPNWETPILDY